MDKEYWNLNNNDWVSHKFIWEVPPNKAEHQQVQLPTPGPGGEKKSPEFFLKPARNSIDAVELLGIRDQLIAKITKEYNKRKLYPPIDWEHHPERKSFENCIRDGFTIFKPKEDLDDVMGWCTLRNAAGEKRSFMLVIPAHFSRIDAMTYGSGIPEKTVPAYDEKYSPVLKDLIQKWKGKGDRISDSEKAEIVYSLFVDAKKAAKNHIDLNGRLRMQIMRFVNHIGLPIEHDSHEAHRFADEMMLHYQNDERYIAKWEREKKLYDQELANVPRNIGQKTNY